MPLPCSQLRVVSDNYPIDGLLNVPFNVLSTADFYVLVTDDIEKVTKQENPKQKSTQTGLTRTHSLIPSQWQLFFSMERTVSRASSWNPAAKFIILFHHIEHRTGLGRWTVNETFQEMALRFHINHLCLLLANTARTYTIYVSKLFLRTEDNICSR